jgi:hypothetical protein
MDWSSGITLSIWGFGMSAGIISWRWAPICVCADKISMGGCCRNVARFFGRKDSAFDLDRFLVCEGRLDFLLPSLSQVMPSLSQLPHLWSDSESLAWPSGLCLGRRGWELAGKLGPWLGSTARSWSWLDSGAGLLSRRLGRSSDLSESWCLCLGGGVGGTSNNE